MEKTAPLDLEGSVENWGGRKVWVGDNGDVLFPDGVNELARGEERFPLLPTLSEVLAARQIYLDKTVTSCLVKSVIDNLPEETRGSEPFGRVKEMLVADRSPKDREKEGRLVGENVSDGTAFVSGVCELKFGENYERAYGFYQLVLARLGDDAVLQKIEDKTGIPVQEVLKDPARSRFMIF